MASGERSQSGSDWSSTYYSPPSDLFDVEMTSPITPSTNTEGSSSDSIDRLSSRERHRENRHQSSARQPAQRGLAADAEVIDLTFEDSDEAQSGSRSRSTGGQQAHRLPRFAREIIDVGEEDDNDTRDAIEDARRHSSPEVEFIEARQLPPRARRTPTPVTRRPRGEDVEVLESRRLPTPHFHARAQWMQAPTHIAVREAARHQLRALQQQVRARVAQLPLPNIGILPRNMNWEAVGFDMGIPREETRTPAPTYDAPPPAPEGFTRSPKEDEVVVCPNCGDELCEGKTEQKKQAWVIKKCGHVYCGDCYHNRTLKNRKAKGTAPLPAPFRHCVVSGCNQKTGHKTAMVQLYL